MGEGTYWKLLLYGAFFAVLFSGLVLILREGSSLFFYLELIGLLFLLLVMLIGFVGYGQRWGDTLFLFIFFVYIINLLLVWGYKSRHGVLLLISIIAFVITLTFVLSGNDEEEDFVPSEQPHSMVFDPPAPEVEVVDIEPEAKVAAGHSPGRLIASKSSNVYHAPKCDWAKRISKARRVWFEDKAEAWDKGYKAHSCME